MVMNDKDLKGHSQGIFQGTAPAFPWRD